MKTLKTLLQEITAGIKAWANASFSLGTHVHGNITNNGKLATASKVVISDSNKNITTSNVSDTELGHLSGVTSAIQTQINSKAYDADVVHTTGNETIAGTKTFASEINGTASKAVADEDGNTINSTYGKLAGSQTWTGENAFSNAIRQNNIRYYRNVPSLTKGTLPSSTGYYGVINDYDSTDTRFMQSRGYISTSGSNVYEWNLSSWNSNAEMLVQMYISADGNTKEFKSGANVLPSSNSTYSLGTLSYRWSTVYADSYYYGTTAWGLDKKNVWTNANHFTGGNYNNGVMLVNSTLDLSQGNPSVAETNQSMICLSDSSKQRSYSRFQSWTASNQTVTILGSTYKPDANSEIDFSVWVSNKPNDTTFHPYGVASPNLGNSTYKWKTLNGVNPGALSLPDKSKATSIDTTNLVYSSEFTFTPTVSGWLFVSVTNCTRASLKTGVGEYYFNQSSGIFRDTVPVIAGEQVTLLFVSTATFAPTVTLYPCLGNV